MAFNRQLLLAVVALAIAYSAVAGLRTVGDADLGWQLAIGRYVTLRHAIPARDVFSYTAAGREFIYPPFSGVAFYLLHALGGYAALSWLGAFACAATIGLLLAGGGAPRSRAITTCLAIVAIPLVADRTKPRADLFSTLLFAAVLVILWRHFRGRPSPLWLLPVIMCAWANLHLGFIAGVVLLAAYVALELLELPFGERGGEARKRLVAAAPWLAAAFAATLLNRWGPLLYAAVARQNRLLGGLYSFVGEWWPLRLSAATARAMLDWRNPDSAYLWLAAAGLLAAGAGIWRKRLGPALLLAGALFGSLYWVRFQVLFAMVAVVTGGELLSSPESQVPSRRRGDSQVLSRPRSRLRTWDLGLGTWDLKVAGIALLVIATAFVSVRIADIVSNRAYLSAPSDTLFGPGVSAWYPRRAAAFLLRERLPANLLNDYNVGGYLTFALWPDYRTSIDNRAVPFGAPLFHLHRRLLASPPSSPLWDQEAGRLGVNTLLIGISRYSGSAGFPLKQFCESPAWRPVYVDETAAIFLRNRPENAQWIARLGSDCSTVQFTPPASTNNGELYNFYMNAGWVLFTLGRDGEALASFDRAHRIFDADPQFYLIVGSVLQANNRVAEAERQYRISLRLRESDNAWYAVGQALAIQGRYGEAAEAIGRAARYAVFPHEIYRQLGQVYLALNRPQDALQAFDRAERADRYIGEAAAQGAQFHAELAAGRARAWLALADLYEAQGQRQLAQEARQRAYRYQK